MGRRFESCACSVAGEGMATFTAGSLSLRASSYRAFVFELLHWTLQLMLSGAILTRPTTMLAYATLSGTA